MAVASRDGSVAVGICHVQGLLKELQRVARSKEAANQALAETLADLDYREQQVAQMRQLLEQLGVDWRKQLGQVNVADNGQAAPESAVFQEQRPDAAASAAPTHGPTLSVPASSLPAGDLSQCQGDEADAVHDDAGEVDTEPPLSQSFAWPAECQTIFMQLPPRITKEDLLTFFPPDGSYDFIHVLYNLKQRRASGQAVLNFVSPEDARVFFGKWHGKDLPGCTRVKAVLSLRPAFVNGLEDNIAYHCDKGVLNCKNDMHLPDVFLTGSQAAAVNLRFPNCLTDRSINGFRLFNFRKLAAQMRD